MPILFFSIRFIILLSQLITVSGILLLVFLWPTINGELFKMTGLAIPWMMVFLILSLLVLAGAGFVLWFDLKIYKEQRHLKGKYSITLMLLIPALILSGGFREIFSETHSMLFMKPETHYKLPELLKSEDGSVITSIEAWENRRRPEILETFATRIYGRLPGESFHPTEIRTVRQGEALNEKALRREIRLSFGKNQKTLELNLLIYQPIVTKQPVPVFIGLNFHGNHTTQPDPVITLPTIWKVNDGEKSAVQLKAENHSRGSRASRWPAETIVERGYALITLYQGDIDPDYDDGFQNGVHPLFARPGRNKPGPGEWGSITAWAWGLSRMMDYIETDAALDNNKVIVIGHSRLGKTALWAGALDQRFAMVISNNSGCLGAAISRRRYGETVAAITERFPHWFTKGFEKFADNEEALPVDQHQLIALIAPRPVYIASADNDLWADPVGEYLGALHASPVYRLYGFDTLKNTSQPATNTPIHTRIGYHLRKGYHDITLYDWQHYLDFADLHLKP